MKRLFLAIGLLCLLAAHLTFSDGAKGQEENSSDAKLISQNIVISQFYGSGGRTGAIFTNDFVELFNRGDQPVNVNGWSIQYASVSGVNWLQTVLPNVTIAPGQYFLVQYTSEGAIGNPLPTPDFVAPLWLPEAFSPNISGTNGKLALVNVSTRLPVLSCPTDSSIVDLVGYGPNATCFEGVPTPLISVTTGAKRNSNGCTETDNNANDFAVVAPLPRNMASPTNVCIGNGNILSASGSANPNSLSPGANTLLRVAVTPATTPPSTGISVTGNLTTIGGSAGQQFFDDGTNGDATAGDNIFSFLYTIPANASGGARTIQTSVTDAQARSANPIINLTINAIVAGEDPLIFGNPSNATADIANEFNYLMNKPQYSLSYHRTRGIPNWVAWRLDSTWIGTAPRQDDYRPDTDLPAGWYQVLDSDYSGSGYDRGHMCPSGDRTRSVADNSATFLMTNFVPQLSANNQGPWEEFESYCRTLAQAGNEIYIFSGGQGSAGTIAAGRVTIPLVTWKVAVVLPNGDNDLARISKRSRVIAIVVPNQPPLNINTPWRNFRVSVDYVEAITGLNFFTNVPKITQELLERRKDNL